MTEATLTPDELEDEALEETPDVESAPDDVVLEISTEVLPPKKFTIDGEPYELYGFEHLSPKQEAKVTACFARFQRTYLALDRAKTESKGAQIAAKVREHRERLIGLLTNVPESVYSALDPAKQGQIMRAIQDEIGAEVEEDIGVDDDEELG